MMNGKMTACEKAQRQLQRVMENGISTKKLLLLGGVVLLSVLGITMSWSTRGRRRLSITLADLDLLKEHFPRASETKSPKECEELLKRLKAMQRQEAKPEAQFKVGAAVTLDPTHSEYRKDLRLSYLVSSINPDGTYNLRIHREIIDAFNKKIDVIYGGVRPHGFPCFPNAFPKGVHVKTIKTSTCSRAERKEAGEQIFDSCKKAMTYRNEAAQKSITERQRRKAKEAEEELHKAIDAIQKNGDPKRLRLKSKAFANQFPSYHLKSGALDRAAGSIWWDSRRQKNGSYTLILPDAILEAFAQMKDNRDSRYEKLLRKYPDTKFPAALHKDIEVLATDVELCFTKEEPSPADAKQAANSALLMGASMAKSKLQSDN